MEAVIEIYPKVKEIKKIYSAKENEINSIKLWESCKDHEITLCLAKTNYNKIIGFLCPMKY